MISKSYDFRGLDAKEMQKELLRHFIFHTAGQAQIVSQRTLTSSEQITALPSLGALSADAMILYALDPKGYDFEEQEAVYQKIKPEGVQQTFREFFVGVYSGLTPGYQNLPFAYHDIKSSLLYADGRFKDKGRRKEIVNTALKIGVYEGTALQVSHDGKPIVSEALRRYLHEVMGVEKGNEKELMYYIIEHLEEGRREAAPVHSDAAIEPSTGFTPPSYKPEG